MRSLSQQYRTAFVTGASAGLGRAFVEMLLGEGVQVWGTARDANRLSALSQHANFKPVVLDLGDPAEAAAAFDRASTEAGGCFDLVVNNAGYGVFGSFTDTDFGVWEKQYTAMLIGTTRICHAALRGMLAAKRGCLVNVASLATEFPLPYMSGYNVAKAGLSALTESLMFETRGTGVVVIDFRPGDFCTGFNQAMTAVAGVPDGDVQMTRAWAGLEANLKAAPQAAVAATALRSALSRRRSGTVRCGSLFQAQLAPVLARLVPSRLRRAAMRRYFGAD